MLVDKDLENRKLQAESEKCKIVPIRENTDDLEKKI